MIVDHICVNFGTPLFQELFLELHKCQLEQNVFYPRSNKHRRHNTETPYRVDSPMVLQLLTKISFSKKRRLMQKQYDPLFQRNKPDMLHAHTLFSDGSLANYYYLKSGTPFIVAIRSTDLDVFLKYKPWLKSYGKQILDHASTIIFISPSLKKRFIQIFGSRYEEKSMIIPNGINPSYLNSGELQKRELHTPLELLYVGSFLKRKNVPALIKLIEKTEARLTIVGEGGNDEKKVLRMVRNSGKVNYLGRIEDQSRLTQIYRQSDIFIMTSKRETFGLVYVEAMSQGLPLVYSKDTGIDDFFEEGAIGYRATPGSISEMKEGINRIIANYQEISRNCIREARQLNWKTIAETYLDIYDLTISQPAEPEQL
jgi:glycosyltransferase involved in cell wall biosynthesis